MPVSLYNTLSRKKEEFRPLEEGIARIYICGPTVYDFAHIGNLRTYVSWDTLGRVLTHAGYKVIETMNVTDIEDKIIANLNGKNLDEFTKKYTNAFISDLTSLHINLPESYETVGNYRSGFLFATHEIAAMGKLIDAIWQKGYAYESEGSIYFDVRKYAGENHYGVLSNVEIAQQKSRIDKDEYDREEVQDFALWKAHKDGDPSFEISVNGKIFKGRPGWHIECTAMSTENLGKTFDIHTGGVDHIFPHHENEIAQARAADPSEDFVKYWLHAEFMLVDGKKMAKSVGNTYTLRDVEEKSFEPEDLRFLFLQAHYRTKLNFTWKSLESARAGRLNLLAAVAEATDGETPGWASERVEKIYAQLEEDLNTPAALAELSTLVREMDAKKEFAGLQQPLSELTELFGLGVAGETEADDSVKSLFEQREEARTNKDWARSDELRQEIEAAGWAIQDSPEGSRLVPKR
jgi:cysteinyl-tRNA synthetase